MFDIALISKKSGNIFYLNSNEVSMHRVTNIEEDADTLLGLESRLLRLQTKLENDIEANPLKTYVVDYTIEYKNGHVTNTKNFLIKASTETEAHDLIVTTLTEAYEGEFELSNISAHVVKVLNV